MIEYVRQKLGRQISQTFSDEEGKIQAFTLEPELEKVLEDSIQSTDQGLYSVLDPDIQNKYGYSKNKPGDANLMICSKNLGEEFKCLSQTLEMPFKQNDNIPDIDKGWSPERSIKLGESLVNTLFKIVDDL
jgi:murein tripeptide amidase MpaA